MSASGKIRDGLKVLALAESSETREQIAAAFSGIAGIELDIQAGDLAGVSPQIMNSHTPDLLLVDVARGDPAVLKHLGTIIRQRGPELFVVATGANATVDSIREMMRAGVLDYLPQPISRTDLASAMEAVSRRMRQARGGETAKGRVIAFLKSAGGMGATTLANHTALALRAGQEKPKVCVLDLDLQFGKVGVYLDIHSAVSVADLIHTPDRLDLSLFRSVISQHASGLHVLTAPPEIIPLESMGSQLAMGIIDLAGRDYDYVIVDLPHDWTEWSHAILKSADAIFLVTQLTVGAIRHARRQIDAVASADVYPAVLSVILNRYERRLWGSDIKVDDAEKALGRSIDYFIPNNFKLVSEALNRGVSLYDIKRGTKFEKRLRQLAETCVATLAPAKAL